MKKLSHAEIASRRWTSEQLRDSGRRPIYCLLDSIRSLYNVGSIFRTADGARIAELILTGYTPFPPRPEIDKTALGATETVPWRYARNPLEPIDELKARGVKICLLEQTDRSIPYFAVRGEDFPLCLVVGNEITGVSKELVAAADDAIEIPMFGMKQSLNAAVAFGIAVFELSRHCPELHPAPLPSPPG
jgi:tRNA G18 (ribose-2'-O)-methylase SpoU